MAQIDETVVEHWLRRQGYATVQGLATRAGDPEKKKRKELDLLALHFGNRELIYAEVQSSPSPATYLGALNSLEDSVRQYIREKFDDERVKAVRDEWCRYQGFEVERLRKMLVYQKLKEKGKHAKKEQLEVLHDEGVEAVSFSKIFGSLKSGEGLRFQFRSDADDLATLFLNTPRFREVLLEEVEASRALENMIYESRKRDRAHHTLLHRKLTVDDIST